VCDVFQSEIAKMSIAELEEFWVSRKYIYWQDEDYCRDGCLYLQLDESIEACNQFLLYQFDGLDELVFDFLNILKQVLNREIPKKNCVEVIALPTSGKNWFFDSILTFCITHGQIMNAKRQNCFPMDNCFNKRILFFNEPNFENSFYDQLLMIFAGDPCSDQAKYKSVCQIKKTPVIVTGNITRFPRETKWQDRVFRYGWKRAEMLKHVKRQCHPLTFVSLLKRYAIEYT
jgi:hypothetical protein